MVERIAGFLPCCKTTDIGVMPQKFFDEELPTLASGMDRKDRLIAMAKRIRAK